MQSSAGSQIFWVDPLEVPYLLFEVLFWLEVIPAYAIIWQVKMNTFPCILPLVKELNCKCMDSKLQFLFLLLHLPVDSPATSVSTQMSELQGFPPCMEFTLINGAKSTWGCMGGQKEQCLRMVVFVVTIRWCSDGFCLLSQFLDCFAHSYALVLLVCCRPILGVLVCACNLFFFAVWQH